MGSGPGKVAPAAKALGFAGLLPQAACFAIIAAVRLDGSAQSTSGFTIAAMIYACAILSFLGGIWWGFAMRRDARQGPLALAAVMPSLLAAGLPIAASFGLVSIAATMVAVGSAILLTLLVDRHLVLTGEAPGGWLGLRVPLSVGLGGLTILIGILMR